MSQHEHLCYRPCVGLMIINPRNLVWIGRRADSKKYDEPEGRGHWWQMPQGGIDEGEQPVGAALRELSEETGLAGPNVEILAESSEWLYYDLPAERIGKAWGGGYRGQKQKWFLIRFTGSDAEINITPDNPEDIEFNDWRWAPSDELVDLIVPFKREVYRAVLAEFAPLLTEE